jgi:hypothetical protein
VLTGSKADLAATSLSKTMTLNVAPAMSVIQNRKRSRGPHGRVAWRFPSTLSTCVDQISPSALANHNCVHRFLVFRTLRIRVDTVARIALGQTPDPRSAVHVKAETRRPVRGALPDADVAAETFLT